MTSDISTADISTADTPTRRPWWVIVLAILGVAGLAFAIGRFSMFGSAGPLPPGETSAEVGFSRDMQVHHAQAVEMAMEIYRKTDDPELRVLSYDIATGQSAQRGEMFDWLVQWGVPQGGGDMMAWMSASDAGHDHGVPAGSAPLGQNEAMELMGMASGAELEQLRAAEGQEADCLFLDLMIRHHEGALPMADALLELGSDPRALQLAATIRTGQSAELDAMTSIQQRLGCG